VTTTRNVPASGAVSELLRNDWTPGGGSVAFAGTAPASAFGGSVGMAGNEVVYTPPPGFTGLDSFSYTITNSVRSAQGTVIASVLDTANPLYHISIQNACDRCQFTFTGIPNNFYELESTTNLSANAWDDIQSLYTGSNGVICFGLTNLPSPSFFRFKAVGSTP